MWFEVYCSMDIAVLISLIGIGIKPSLIRSTHIEKFSILESGSGLDLDLNLAGIHEQESAELNLDLSLGNDAFKSNKAPTAYRPTPIRFGSNPLYFSEDGFSRHELLSLGLSREKYNMMSDTESTRRSIGQLEPQTNFYLHAPPKTLNPEKLSGERITLGDSKNEGELFRINDGSSGPIKENHRIVYSNLPFKKKFTVENFPTEVETQNQNFQNSFGLKVLDTSKSYHETSYGKSLIVKELEPQKVRTSAGSSRPTKKRKVSDLERTEKGRKYRTNRTSEIKKEKDNAKVDIWKDVKVNEYKGLPSFRNWILFIMKNKSNIECLAEPYDNVLYLTTKDLKLLSKSIISNIDYYKKNRCKMFSTKQRKLKILDIYKQHDDFFSNWKTDDSTKYFEALGKSWEADYNGRTDKFQARVQCVRFATAYALQRIGYLTENNNFKIFVDIEKAKEDAYEILKSYWKTLPLGRLYTGTWQGGKNEKPTNIPLLDHLRLPKPNSALRASYGSDTLLFALRHIIPNEYYQSLFTSTRKKKKTSKNFIRNLNNIAFSVDHQKLEEISEDKNLKLD
ncbi:hypothetical protein BY996DRAFT_6411795 [Phakopsora pachyrhizi]|uniref:Expressed protein n=1 Tax=Phakopsora pachyrhizi TaxID=170000 RepID=A0AAV0ALU0_PHAPC|nr:hypothetical protein BY996DRAFT_6411795 [Phakopsora pachyrhizi]CAH7669735.1 expressed protein [Phakopsora pachyrhizi]